MKRMRVGPVVGFTFAAWFCVAGGACRPKDDEKLILALLEKAAVLAEEHKTGSLMNLTTETFTAGPGTRDREEVRGILTYAFMRYGNFRIKFPSPAIEIQPPGDMANVKVPFVVFREGTMIPDLTNLYNDPGKWIEEVGKRADPYHLELWLAKIEGEWIVQRAHLEGIRSLEGL